jgi:hypothetical protein
MLRCFNIDSYKSVEHKIKAPIYIVLSVVKYCDSDPWILFCLQRYFI